MSLAEPLSVALVSTFPTLLAVPITRAGTFLPQAARPLVPLSDADGSYAPFRIALGGRPLVGALRAARAVTPPRAAAPPPS